VLVLNEDGMTNGWRPLFIGDALALTETVSGLTVVGLAMFFDLAEDVEPGDVCASGDIGHSSVNLRPDIGVRKDVEGPLPPTLDKVFDWLVAKGLDVGRHDALELLRILNGWDGPKPE
jgi:hypothetical protein